MQKISVKTNKRNEFINITNKVKDAIASSKVKNGICVVFCPHTTGGITINECCDPAVEIDLSYGLQKISPQMPEYRHAEGNSDSHLKSSMIGASETVIIQDGQLMLGTWQGLYFAEFDGPRNREVWINVIGQ